MQSYLQNTISADGLKDDFSDLPPTQRRKKLLSKLQQIQKDIQQEQGAWDGLMKMKGVYEQNSLLGDPQSVEGQLKECDHKLEKLRNELNKYQNMMDQINNQTAQASPQASRNTKQNGGNRTRYVASLYNISVFVYFTLIFMTPEGQRKNCQCV
jgi:hypothetical protein